MVFVLIAPACLKQSGASPTFVPVKNFVRLSLKKIWNTVAKKESSINSGEDTYKRKAWLSLKCGSVSGGYCTRQLLMLDKKLEQFYLIGVHWQITNY